jgi:hypothetical protein
MAEDEYLRVTVDADSDGTGKLIAEVASSGYAGRGGAYFDLQRLAEFAQELRAWPLSQSNPPYIEGGFWSQDKRDVLEQLHLSIRAYPIGSKGQVGIRVRLADPPLWPDDRLESQNVADIEIMTSYEELQRFANDLKLVIESKLDEAVLKSVHFL